MKARLVTEHVFCIPLGIVNVFLIALPDRLILVDAGPAGSWRRIAGAIRQLGRRPQEVREVAVTHLHGDHTGALAEIKTATGARLWAHPAEAALLAEGHASRPWRGAPGSLVGALGARFAGKGTTRVAPVVVDMMVEDGEWVPVAGDSGAASAGVGSGGAGLPGSEGAEAGLGHAEAGLGHAEAGWGEAKAGPPGAEPNRPGGGLIALWTPGHTEGHVAYLWPAEGGVLFVGDAAVRVLRLSPAPLYEDYARGLASLQRLATLGHESDLASLTFETACFAHGRALVGGAAKAFARKWGGGRGRG